MRRFGGADESMDNSQDLIEPTDFSDLPEELIVKIFSYLPPDDQLKAVNRQFYRLDTDSTEVGKAGKNKRYIDWLRSNNHYIEIRGANFAAAEGKLDVVKWLWDKGVHANVNGANLAALNGHLPVVRWLWDQGVHANVDGAYNAVKNGQLETLKWLWGKGLRVDRGPYHAAKNGHLKTLEWLWEQRVDSNYVDIANYAARDGKLDIVKWLWDKGYQVSDYGANNAAENGHLETVQWLWDKGYRAPGFAATNAARNGKFETANWLRKNIWDYEDSLRKNNKTRNPWGLRESTW